MKIIVSEILDIVGGKLVQGDEKREFSKVGALNEVGEDGVSFFGNEKYLDDYLASSAGLIFVAPGVEKKQGEAVLIEVVNPSYAFGQLMSHCSGKKRVFKPGVHPSAIIADGVEYDPARVCVKAGAVVEEGVKIGDGSEIGANSVIGENVTIGKNCLIHANVTVREYCVLGDRVALQPGCVIGSDGYGYEQVAGQHMKVDQLGNVVIGDDVEIGANTTIDRARFGETLIGKGTKIDNQVQIAHNVEIGEHCLIISQSGVAGSTKLGNYVVLAAQAGIGGHLEIGDQAVITAKAGVIKNLHGSETYMGFPARPMKQELKKRAALNRLPDKVKKLEEFTKGLI